MLQSTDCQRLWYAHGHEPREFALPSPSSEVMPGVWWGRADEFGTPAFWKMQTALRRETNQYTHHDLGSCLLEEVAACLLGGYGIPAELGLAAFDTLRTQKLLDGHAHVQEIYEVLEQPLPVAGAMRRYRFSRQKALYLAEALAELRTVSQCSDLELRSILLDLRGIGPKTASWIVRNHCNSSRVAILDIHVVRACVGMGVFPHEANPAKSYFSLEAAFLEFCAAIAEPAAIVDALIWDAMRRIGPKARRPRTIVRSITGAAEDSAAHTYDLFAFATNGTQHVCRQCSEGQVAYASRESGHRQELVDCACVSPQQGKRVLVG